MITWLIRLLILGALAVGAVLVTNRRKVVREMERATERVDDKLKAVERKADDVRESKENLEDAARDAKRRVF